MLPIEQSSDLHFLCISCHQHSHGPGFLAVCLSFFEINLSSEIYNGDEIYLSIFGHEGNEI